MYQKQFAEYFDKHMEEILRDLDETPLLNHLARVHAKLLTGERLILKSLA